MNVPNIITRLVKILAQKSNGQTLHFRWKKGKLNTAPPHLPFYVILNYVLSTEFKNIYFSKILATTIDTCTLKLKSHFNIKSLGFFFSFAAIKSPMWITLGLLFHSNILMQNNAFAHATNHFMLTFIGALFNNFHFNKSFKIMIHFWCN